jgi:FkbM family methyltransferase
MKRVVKQVINALPSQLRFKLLRYFFSLADPYEKAALGQQNLVNALSNLKKLGFLPSCVLDVGAHNGNWSHNTKSLYPEIEYILFEPLPGKAEKLKQRFVNTNTVIYPVLLGGKHRIDVPFYKMETGSSVYEELTNVPREKILLDMFTLDSVLSKHQIGNAALLKIDVQGFELEVLSGAKKTLNAAEVICMEVSFIPYNQGAPLIVDVLPVMKSYGFLPLDFVGFFRKMNDNMLIQADMLFINEKSAIRTEINRLDYDDFRVVES